MISIFQNKNLQIILAISLKNHSFYLIESQLKL